MSEQEAVATWLSAHCQVATASCSDPFFLWKPSLIRTVLNYSKITEGENGEELGGAFSIMDFGLRNSD